MNTEENPLLAARPPTTDYITYLTIVEYNLTKTNLPTLLQVLQDQELTVNIGWDLVQLLLPLLPESEPCLQVISRLGNPREVILKVTEALRLIDHHPAEEEGDDDDEDNEQPTATVEPSTKNSSNSNDTDVVAPRLPLPVIQFQALVSMLSILHPRVKTKYPSRFLSSSLQAILTSYADASTHFGDLTGAVLSFFRTLSGTRRPHLPPRKSSSHVQQASADGVADDPEAQVEQPDGAEKGLVHRFLQAFLTHILEDYMLHLKSTDDIPGLSWSARFEAKVHPARIFRRADVDVKTVDRNADEQRNRSFIVSQIAALARDLGLRSDELYGVALNPAMEATGMPSHEDDPPASADDIPISKTGALFLLTARSVAEKILDNEATGISLSIFPDHLQLLENFLSTEPLASIGTESEAIIDTLVVLGLIALENGDIGEPEDDDQFTHYLQLVSLLAANTPSPSLRYYAYLLTTTVLRSHPSSVIRLSFIRDTLEHCPYANLKTTAVGWLKGETLEATAFESPHFFASIPTRDHIWRLIKHGELAASDPSISAHPPRDTTAATFLTHDSSSPNQSTNPDEPTDSAIASDSSPEHSIFATPLALSTCAPSLFPDLTHDLTLPSLQQTYSHLKSQLSFYLAALNFYYLLLSAKPLHPILEIPAFHQDNDIGGSFLGPLSEASVKFRKALEAGGELYELEGENGARLERAELNVLDDVLERVKGAVAGLN